VHPNPEQVRHPHRSVRTIDRAAGGSVDMNSQTMASRGPITNARSQKLKGIPEELLEVALQKAGGYACGGKCSVPYLPVIREICVSFAMCSTTPRYPSRTSRRGSLSVVC
jgi:hypothetical protein